jgi:hypothetical protein
VHACSVLQALHESVLCTHIFVPISGAASLVRGVDSAITIVKTVRLSNTVMPAVKRALVVK